MILKKLKQKKFQQRYKIVINSSKWSTILICNKLASSFFLVFKKFSDFKFLVCFREKKPKPNKTQPSSCQISAGLRFCFFFFSCNYCTAGVCARSFSHRWHMIMVTTKTDSNCCISGWLLQLPCATQRRYRHKENILENLSKQARV